MVFYASTETSIITKHKSDISQSKSSGDFLPHQLAGSLDGGLLEQVKHSATPSDVWLQKRQVSGADL